MKGKERTIQVECLARIEGEAGLHVTVRDGKLVSSQVRVFEPPRLFEAFLKGRSFREVPDITARICGICPVAYQLTAVQAIEKAFSIEVDDSIRALRDLLYCAEWIASHSLHVFLLHGPDFLGYADGLRMAKDHPEPVLLGLELKKLGNELVALIGGREVHPVNVRIGGFHRLPDRGNLKRMEDKLKRALDQAMGAVRWASKLPFPDYDRDYEFVALQSDGAYPLYQGQIVSSSGLRLAPDRYEEVFVEDQAPHSHALHSRLKGHSSFVVGPLARFNLNRSSLMPRAREACEEAGLATPCRNLFQSIVIRCIEIVQACEWALELIGSYEPSQFAACPVRPLAGTGHGCSEAPRGLLYHRYVLDENGILLEAKLVPPTAQNLLAMEEDLANLVTRNVNIEDSKLTWLCEQAVRSYDPCISCATHLLEIP
ncbi:MAG: Ni/Fe hydrogenase subunit alpha [Syntrophobacteraceae bacterium]